LKVINIETIYKVNFHSEIGYRIFYKTTNVVILMQDS
jgi:hypothetical protein